jgi:peptidoglycan/LPS O-acetylase OafA/YrhL
MALSGNILRNNNFNFFRLLFATLVILAHSFELLDGNRSREPLTVLFGTLTFGELAVDGFFLLSGYLIVQSWCGKPNMVAYFLKRVLRIFPGFIVASLVCLLIIAPLGALTDSYYSEISIKSALWDLIRLQTPHAPPYALGTHTGSINGAMWSISFEFRCYMYVIAFGLLGLPKRRYLWLLGGLGIAALFMVMEISQHIGFNPVIAGRLPLSNGLNLINARLSMFFFSGGIFYLYREKIPLKGVNALVACGLLLLAMNYQLTAEIAVASAGAYILFYFALMPIRRFGIFQRIPDVSYGLYLYGWPIQLLVLWKFPMLDGWAVFAISTLFGLLAGLVSWYLIEKPFIKLKPQRKNPSPVITLGSVP